MSSEHVYNGYGDNPSHDKAQEGAAPTRHAKSATVSATATVVVTSTIPIVVSLGDTSRNFDIFVFHDDVWWWGFACVVGVVGVVGVVARGGS